MRVLFLVLFYFVWSVALTLEQAIELATKNHVSAKLSELELLKAEESIRRARSGILPQVSFSYSYTRLSQELALSSTPRDRHSYILEVEQSVFNKVVFENIELAREQKELQELIKQDVLREVEFQTKELFYALLYKREMVKLSEESLKYWEEVLKQAELRFKDGLIPKVELMRAKAQLETAKANFEGAKADYRKGLEEFRALLRLEERVEPAGTLTYIPVSEKPADIETLLKVNSTLKVSKKSLEIAKKTVEVQRSQYYPVLNLFANYQGSTTRRGRQTEMADGYTFGVRFSYRMFDGFSREASIAQSRIEVLKQVERLKDLEHRVKAEFLKVLEDINFLQVQIGALELSLQSAKESMRLSTERYRFGVATQLEVLEAVNNYNSILQKYYLTLFQYNTAIAKLERLTK